MSTEILDFFTATKRDEPTSKYSDPNVTSIAVQIERWEKRQKSNQAAIVRRFVIDPRTSSIVGYWDGVISLALIFTAAITPVEVGFMQIPRDRWHDSLFLCNRAIDAIFIIDMALQFVLMYQPESAETSLESVPSEPSKPSAAPSAAGGGGEQEATTSWVSDHKLIAKHYVLSWWFPLDFFSIGVSAFDIFSPEDSALSSFKALRAVRVLRLLKLVRLARGSRIFKRWEMRLSINYAVLSIVNICVMLVFVCHLFACVWGLQASFDPMNSWLGPGGNNMCVAWDDTTPCPGGQVCNNEGYSCARPGQQYLYSLYWSIATVTSIGYGDVVATETNVAEQAICVCMMLSGSLLFAYLVGSFCGLAANLSPDIVRFRQDLTDLNKFLTANAIPPGLRYQLREYMHQTLHLRTAATGNRLLSGCASRLRNEVALTVNERWLNKIELLNECEDGLVLELAFALALQIFPPGDSCPLGHIYIVCRGSALFAGRAYAHGACWGEAEALLLSDRLRFPIPASAISYLFTYSIDGATLRQMMSQHKYPDASQRLRRRQVQWIVRRGIVRFAEERNHLPSPPPTHNSHSPLPLSFTLSFTGAPRRGAPRHAECHVPRPPLLLRQEPLGGHQVPGGGRRRARREEE